MICTLLHSPIVNDTLDLSLSNCRPTCHNHVGFVYDILIASIVITLFRSITMLRGTDISMQNILHIQSEY